LFCRNRIVRPLDRVSRLHLIQISRPWTWLDLFVQIIAAIIAGGALISVPFFATQEREAELVHQSVKQGRRMFTIGACLVAFVVFVWFMRDFIVHHA
jgi:hypothetical protein